MPCKSNNFFVDLNHVNGNLLQFVESLHSLLLAEILPESVDQKVIVYCESTVAGIEGRQLVNEDAGRIIHVMHLECLAEHLHLDKCRQGVYARFLVHGLK